MLTTVKYELKLSCLDKYSQRIIHLSKTVRSVKNYNHGFVIHTYTKQDVRLRRNEKSSPKNKLVIISENSERLSKAINWEYFDEMEKRDSSLSFYTKNIVL